MLKSNKNRGLYYTTILISCMALLIILIRLNLHVGWGGDLDHLENDVNSTFGIVFNEEDNLTYVSWAQQAFYGIFPFSILYTTTPHSSLLIIPVFVIIGKIAGVLSLHPLFILNITGFLFALLAIVFLFLCCKQLGLSDRGAFLGTALTIFGSGLSWLPWILSHALNLHLPAGGDLYYFDLFPVTAFVFYPYNTIGIALSSMLLFCLLKSEKNILEQKRYHFLLYTFLVGLALAVTRPYEPAIFLFNYAFLIILMIFFTKQKQLLFTRLIIFSILLIAILPQEIYNYWVSTQDVWNNFASQSLSLFPGRLTWLLGFGLFWPLSFWGIYIAIKKKQHYFHILSIWIFFLFFLLVIFKSDKTKLASSGFLSMGILSGYAVDYMLSHIESSHIFRIRKSTTIIIIFIIISVSLSPLIAFTYARLPLIDTEIVKATKIIRQHSPKTIPTILTDTETGSLLPGLAGIRVYAGHWALTDDWKNKMTELKSAGFRLEPTEEILGKNSIKSNLDKLLKKSDFDFILAKKIHLVFPILLADKKNDVLYYGKRWVVFRINMINRKH